MLVAKGLSKSYGDQKVLSQVDVRVNRGEFLVILGPNGSGKSTLLKLLVGEEPPGAGSVWLKGKELCHYSLKERAQTIAVLAQAGLKDVPFTVEEVVRLGRHPYLGKWPWLRSCDEEIVQRVMEETDVLAFKHRLVAELSGGERQRVAIAKAMAQDPELLVLDEPTTYLDLQYQLAILDLIKEWQQQKQQTVIAVLHDVNLAAQYGDRLLLLKEGKVVQAGSPEEMIQPQLIESVFGVKPLVIPHPTLQVPQVFLQSVHGKHS